MDIMATLAENPKSCLWLRDWAQKVLPQSFREAQKDYFGKKGMSLHIDVFLKSSEAGKMQKYVFFTILNASEQDHLDTLSLASLVLPTFLDEAGEIDVIYGKSDNAKCYTANGYVLGMHHVCRVNDVFLKRYDYNEPQRGKDQADRESAVARRLMKSYVNSGNDLHNANDIKKGLLYMGGPPCSYIGIAEVSKSSCSLETDTIPGISSYHSYEFAKSSSSSSQISLKAWKYYNVGVGKNITAHVSEYHSGAVAIGSFTATSRQEFTSTSTDETGMNLY